MGLLTFLTDKTAAGHNATAQKAAEDAIYTVFPQDRWSCEIDVSEYSGDNVQNLWNNELRKVLRQALTQAGKTSADFKAWLGDIHFVNIRVTAKHAFEKSKSNQGWRVSILSLPAAQVIAVGLASHYQGGQDHNALGRASGLLHDVAMDAIPEEQGSLPGRKASAEDWDKAGLFVTPVTSISGVTIPGDAQNGKLFLKDVRTTTVKKILASYFAVESIGPNVGEEGLLDTLRKWERVAWILAKGTYPFRSVQEFEPIRALALQDLAAASLRLQLRRKSSTRSIVRIYYGPPGTGKTLTAVRDAVKLADPSYNDQGDITTAFARFNELAGQVAFITFHQALQYEDAIESIRPVLSHNEHQYGTEDEESTQLSSEGGVLTYRLHEGVILRMIRAAAEAPEREFVMVIDEINRGDVSRILGPLISALEPDKRVGAEYPIGIELQYPRAEALETRLFLPSNIHFLGTMNSADRNIALVDHALRRRFEFVAVPPEPNLLTNTTDADPIDLQQLLMTLNARVSHLLGSEYCIGHGYFMSCKTNEDVIRVMAQKVIPLLSEYFFGNPGLLLLVLGDRPGNATNIHLITEPNTAFETLFNVPRDIASGLGYRPHEADLTLRLDPFFWDGARAIPGPQDADYAAKAIRKIYANGHSSVEAVA